MPRLPGIRGTHGQYLLHEVRTRHYARGDVCPDLGSSRFQGGHVSQNHLPALPDGHDRHLRDAEVNRKERTPRNGGLETDDAISFCQCKGGGGVLRVDKEAGLGQGQGQDRQQPTTPIVVAHMKTRVCQIQVSGVAQSPRPRPLPTVPTTPTPTTTTTTTTTSQV